MLFPNWGSLKDSLPLCALAVPPKTGRVLSASSVTSLSRRKGDSLAWPELKTRVYVFLAPRKGLIFLCHREHKAQVSRSWCWNLPSLMPGVSPC